MARDKAAYAGREQAYVKHYLLETYLENLFHKTAGRFDTLVYVDGYSGPWQSSGQRLEDTSFIIALDALRQAKSSWAKHGRRVHVEAHLVEQAKAPYETLRTIPAKYPDVEVVTYNRDFREIAGSIASAIPSSAFTFLFIDPKGWRINLSKLAPLLSRGNTEVLFNFMFEFINRAASMSDPALVSGLDELISVGGWRERLREATTPEERKAILVEAFSESLRDVGGYSYVAETPVFRPVRDRTLYSLIYATCKPVGLEVFRDCQVAALDQQAEIRGEAKIRAAAERTKQTELFGSFNDMAPDREVVTRQSEEASSEQLLLELVPKAPDCIMYGAVWPQVLERHVIRKIEVGAIAARLRARGDLSFLDWGPKVRRPRDEYRVSRP